MGTGDERRRSKFGPMRAVSQSNLLSKYSHPLALLLERTGVLGARVRKVGGDYRDSGERKIPGFRQPLPECCTVHQRLSSRPRSLCSFVDLLALRQRRKSQRGKSKTALGSYRSGE